MVGKRRIDRVLDPELPSRVGELATADVRALRDDCREEESRLSYLRRLLHARLDIAGAEAARRGGDAEELLGRLPQILSEHSGRSRDARSLRVYQPSGDEPQRREEDHLVDDAALARLPELGDEELEGLVQRLSAYEREISSQRAKVLEHLDLLQDELVGRYRDGRASVSEVLSSDGDA